MHATAMLANTVTSIDADSLSVRVLRSIEEIEEVRDSWTAWQDHPNSDIDFYLMIQRTTHKPLRPYVVVLYRHGVPDAMLVGRIEDSNIEIRLGYAKVLAPRVRMLNIVYGGLLGHLTLENTEALVSELRNGLRRRDADVAILRFVRTDSPAFDFALRLPRVLQRDHCLAPQMHRSMTLTHSIEALRGRFSAKVRKNQRWQANKLLRDHSGNVRIRCFRDADELDELFRDTEAIAIKTYQRGLGVGFKDDEQMRLRLQFEAERGSLRAYLLYVAERPTAFWIGTVYKGTFFSSFMGYEPSMGSYSPGMFLVMRVIEGFCANGAERDATRIDFGLGDAAYKSLLGDSQWTEASVHLFSPALKSVSLNVLRTPMVLMDRWLKDVLEKTQLLPRVKHFWRKRASKTSGFPKSEKSTQSSIGLKR